MTEEKKAIAKEKLMEKRNGIKDWISSHKDGLIRGGIIAGAIAAVGGVLTAVMNRCGAPCGDTYTYEEIDIYDCDCDCDPSEELEEVDILEEIKES